MIGPEILSLELYTNLVSCLLFHERYECGLLDKYETQRETINSAARFPFGRVNGTGSQ